MLELGSFSASEHRRIGTLVPTSADLLITVGVRAKGIAEGARDADMSPDSVFEYERGADAVSYLTLVAGEGDVLLVKGSQSMRMEKVTKALMRHPERAKELLPRQDEDWLSR